MPHLFNPSLFWFGLSTRTEDESYCTREEMKVLSDHAVEGYEKRSLGNEKKLVQ